jgi:hypothetical protein
MNDKLYELSKEEIDFMYELSVEDVVRYPNDKTGFESGIEYILADLGVTDVPDHPRDLEVETVLRVWNWMKQNGISGEFDQNKMLYLAEEMDQVKNTLERN